MYENSMPLYVLIELLNVLIDCMWKILYQKQPGSCMYFVFPFGYKNVLSNIYLYF